MGFFTQRKLNKASEAVGNALNAGLGLRHLMTMAGLLDEAKKQSEMESRVAESLNDAGQAWATGNVYNGARSVAWCLLSAEASSGAVAKLWDGVDLAEKINLNREDHNLAAQLTGLQTFSSDEDFKAFKEGLKKAIREGIKETSRLFREAEAALEKAREGL
jgi:hypothetical protein